MIAPLHTQELPADQGLNVLALCGTRSGAELRWRGYRTCGCRYAPSLQKLTRERLEIGARSGDVVALSACVGRGMGHDTSRKDLLHLRLKVGALIGRAGRAYLNEDSRRADCQEATEGLERLR